MANCAVRWLTRSRFIAGFKAFFNNVFQGAALETQVRKHLFQPAVFILKALHLFDIRGFHAAELCFSVVVRDLRDPGLAADVFNGASGFEGLQNSDDLVFGESCFAHSDLLQGHIQYAGRSLNVNGPIKRDTYSPNHQSFALNGLGKTPKLPRPVKAAWGIKGKLGDGDALFVLIDSEAGNLLFAVGFQLRLELCAGAEAALTAGVERAAWRWIQRAGQLTSQLDALAA